MLVGPPVDNKLSLRCVPLFGKCTDTHVAEPGAVCSALALRLIQREWEFTTCRCAEQKRTHLSFMILIILNIDVAVNVDCWVHSHIWRISRSFIARVHVMCGRRQGHCCTWEIWRGTPGEIQPVLLGVGGVKRRNLVVSGKWIWCIVFLAPSGKERKML